jgi:hypothetical protein
MTALHITNGSAAADKLATFVDGPVVTEADVLHEGPAPRVDDETWYALRAAFLSGGDARRGAAIRDSLAASDRAIRDACDRGEEVVLWFEHDLFDQLQVIRTVDLMPRDAPNAWLICIDRFPGVERFIGLGQLTPDELATLPPLRAPITTEQAALASDAWDAFRSPDPRPLLAAAQRLTTDANATAALPFLGDALLRFLAEYPSTHSGLSRTEELALAVLADSDGPLVARDLFVATQRREARPFLGDLPFFDTMRALSAARTPLVAIDGGEAAGDLGASSIAITDAGRAVLDGRQDHIALNGIDRWRGGVHLRGRDRSPWRWHARAQTLVS